MNLSIKKFTLTIITYFCVLTGGVFLFKFIWNEYIYTQAIGAYKDWKKFYVVQVQDSMSRVINPQDNKITVSEGMGYGLLFSAANGDSETFERLWRYTKKYFDENGLMHWKVDSSGNVVGIGSASDADQDIAYSLLIASEKWPEKGYKNAALMMIDSIVKHEVNKNYLLLPGDKWGGNPPINPSYISPAYYTKFASISGKDYWNKISSANLQFLIKIANEKTGLLPDWINEDGTIIEKDNSFGYDAIRVPIRLLQFYKETKNISVGKVLQRQYEFSSKIGTDNLKAGYTVAGKPRVPYINGEYLSSFAAMSFRFPYSMFNIKTIHRLINTNCDNYYGSSLKVWSLLIIIGKL
jgi:endoglucanase